MELICNGREILQCKPNIKNGEWGLKLEIIGYNWKFGDMCQWNGKRCIVIDFAEDNEKEREGKDYLVMIMVEKDRPRLVRASKLLPAYKENTIDGYVIRSDCEHFLTISGTLVWNTYYAAEKALKRILRGSGVTIEECDEKILHYQIEYRNYPTKFDCEKER